MGSKSKRQVKRDRNSPSADEERDYSEGDVEPKIKAKRAKGPQPYAPGAKSSLAELDMKI